jgi:hypothetical protein
MTAVVTGEHDFDVPSFQRMWRDLPGVDAYLQGLDNFGAADRRTRETYDVIAFYNFHQENPDHDDEWGEGIEAALADLGRTRQGVLVLHHAILAFPDLSLWSELTGIQNRSFDYHNDQRIQVSVAPLDHPVTAGLTDWEQEDETYTMHDAGPGSTVLLTTEHNPSMRTLAWTRTYRQSPVFCLQLGHDRLAFENPQFRQIVAQGIHWLAGRSEEVSR